MTLFERGRRAALNTDEEDRRAAWAGLTKKEARQCLLDEDDADEAPERRYTAADLDEFRRGVRSVLEA